MEFKLNERCCCQLCTGYMTRKHARVGSMTEIIRTVVFDNRLGGLFHNSQQCKNCKRCFYAGTGRWTESSNMEGWIKELRQFYVMIGEGPHIRVTTSTVSVYVSTQTRWQTLCTPEEVKDYLLDCRQHLKEQYKHYSLCFCSTECLYTYGMMLANYTEYCNMHDLECE